MSLVPFAMRVATVRALQAVMPAPVEVFDSPQDPLALLDATSPRPVIAVSTGRIETTLTGRELLGGMSVVPLGLLFLLPERFEFPVRDGASITIDTRRQGAETALDVLTRISMRALNASMEPWAALWREFVQTTPKVDNLPFIVIPAQGTTDVRVVARELLITCEPLHEPLPGGAPAGAWADLLELMRADTGGDGLSSLADWIESEIRGGADLTQEERDRIYIGLSDYVARSVGVGGPLGDRDNDPLGGLVADEAPADPDDFTEQDQ